MNNFYLPRFLWLSKICPEECKFVFAGPKLIRVPVLAYFPRLMSLLQVSLLVSPIVPPARLPSEWLVVPGVAERSPVTCTVHFNTKEKC